MSDKRRPSITNRIHGDRADVRGPRKPGFEQDWNRLAFDDDHPRYKAGQDDTQDFTPRRTTAEIDAEIDSALNGVEEFRSDKPSRNWESPRKPISGSKDWIRPDLSKHPYADDDFRSYDSSKSYAPAVRCYHNHPALIIPGTGLMVHGGSCISPSHKTADIYIGFEHGMNLEYAKAPWEGGATVLHHIPDMGTPKDIVAFRRLIDWTIEQLHAGKSVHAGCIGGHGRTGTFMAALVAAATSEKDAVRYVRENYCKKAVESEKQVRFLQQNFGVKSALGTKSYKSYK